MATETPRPEESSPIGREASELSGFVSEPTVDYVDAVAKMATKIKRDQLREKMNHTITGGDVLAIIGAIRELRQAH